MRKNRQGQRGARRRQLPDEDDVPQSKVTRIGLEIETKEKGRNDDDNDEEDADEELEVSGITDPSGFHSLPTLPAPTKLSSVLVKDDQEKNSWSHTDTAPPSSDAAPQLLVYDDEAVPPYLSRGSGPRDEQAKPVHSRRRGLCVAAFLLLAIVVVTLVVVVVILLNAGATDGGGGNSESDSIRGAGGDENLDGSVPTSTTTAGPTAAPLSTGAPILPTLTTLSPATTLPTSVNPTFAPTSAVCPSLCYGGGTMTRPDARVYPNHNNTLTCRELEQELPNLAQSALTPEITCLQHQIRASIRCGCPYPHPEASCTLCPNNTLPDDETLNTLTPILSNRFDVTSNLTCADLIFRAAFGVTGASATAASSSYLVSNPSASSSVSSSCKTKTQPQWAPHCQCAGSDLGYDDDNAGVGSSSSLILVPENILPRTIPPLVQPVPTTSPTVAAKQESEVLPTNQTCPICHDGSVVANASALLFPEIDSLNVTCGQLQETFAEKFIEAMLSEGLAADPAEACLHWQIEATVRCGCPFPHPEVKCTICPDGTLPSTENLFRETAIGKNDGRPAVCARLIVIAAITLEDDEVCRDIRGPEIAAECSCPGYERRSEPNLPNVPTQSPNKETLAPTLAPSLRPTPSRKCPVCFNGLPISNPSALLFPNAEDESASSLTCADVENRLDAIIEASAAEGRDPDIECFWWQTIGSVYCGCDFPHPQAVCTICPDGSLPPDDVLHEVVAIVEFENSDETVDFTCGQLVLSAATLPGNGEPACSEIIIPEWSSACQCPGFVPPPPPPPPSSCPLCPDGRELPNPSALAFPGYPSLVTCGELEQIVDQDVASSIYPQTACLEWQLIASMSCGCEFPHPQAACKICPDGTLPPPDVLARATPETYESADFVVNRTCFDLIVEAGLWYSDQEFCQDRVVPLWAPFCSCPGYI